MPPITEKYRSTAVVVDIIKKVIHTGQPLIIEDTLATPRTVPTVLATSPDDFGTVCDPRPTNKQAQRLLVFECRRH